MAVPHQAAGTSRRAGLAQIVIGDRDREKRLDPFRAALPQSILQHCSTSMFCWTFADLFGSYAWNQFAVSASGARYSGVVLDDQLAGGHRAVGC